MKKNFKRWLAFLLAVVVIATTCIHSSDAFLWADEEDAPVTEPEETMQTLTVDSSDDAGSGGDEQYSDDEGGFEDEGEYSDEGGSEDGDSEYSGDEGGFEDDSEDYGDGSEDDAADSAEGSDGENADAAEDGSGSGNEGEDVDGENTENSEDTDDSEDEEGFSYVICFYFDGTEDESARISGTDGKSGESILGFATIADKKEHDGKNYVLDRIENKDGVITEDAGSNVVGVYYVAAKEDEEPEEKYGYEIHFYYDGKEGDVKKGEGAPDKEILSFATIEDKKEFNGKKYILDSIENKDGKIIKDTEKNVVNVYYVLADEDVKTCSLKFESNLSDGGKAEVVSVSPKDGMTGSLYKEGTKVTFEVSVNDGYELLTVENRDGELKAQSEKDNVYTYTVTMTEDMVITVTYEEKMPEQKLSAGAGKVGVTIDVPEGVLPDGTIAEVQSVDSDDVADAIMAKLAEDELYPVEITAVDIKLFKDGELISPKGDVTVTLENVFDASISGKKAAVYHVNGNSAEYVGSADPASSDVTFDTNHFSVYAAVKAVPMDEVEDGIMTLEETGNKGVNRGIKVVYASGRTDKTYLIQGQSDGDSHSWEIISNGTEVKISGDTDMGAVNIIAGNKEGNAILKHCYGNQAEYWTINVISEPGGGILRVFMFIKVNAEQGVDTTGWTLNGSGYYTIGYVDIDSNQEKFRYKEKDELCKILYKDLTEQIENGTIAINRVNNAIDINLNEVIWKEVVTSWKADEFLDADIEAYHLNGTIEMTSGSYTVKYYRGDEKEPEKEDMIDNIPIKIGADVPIDADKIKSNPFGEEYEFDYYLVEGEETKTLPEKIKNGGIIEVHYKKVVKFSSYTVTYHYFGEDGKTETQDPKEENNVEIGKEISYEAKATTQFNGANYILDDRYGNGTGIEKGVSNGTVSENPDDNTVEVYYVLDANGPDGKPDGTADYEEYKVYYAGGKGVIGNSVTDGNLYPAGYEVKVTGLPEEFVNSNKNALFGNWKTSQVNLKEETYEAGNLFKMPNQDVTLTAQWKIWTVSKTISSITDKDGKTKDKAGEGDKVNFTITVRNEGDVELKDISVTDTGISGGGKVVIERGNGYNRISDNEAQVKSLPVSGQPVEIKAYHIVTKNEVGKAELFNTATASVEKNEISDTSEPIPMEDVAKQLTVKKERVKPETATADGKYTTGNTVWFEITVKNTGNITLKNIYVAESEDFKDAVFETGDGYVIKGGKAIIEELKPEKEVVISVSYKIKETDLGKTDFRNMATVTSEDIDKPIEASSEPVPMAERTPDIKLVKSLADEKGNSITAPAGVKIGDTVYYRIDIENVGNVDLNYLEVQDFLTLTLNGDVKNGELSSFRQIAGTPEIQFKGNTAVITKLPYDGESEERNVALLCSYKIAESDAGKTINNKVTVTLQESPDFTRSDEAAPVTVNGLSYEVRYYYGDGETWELAANEGVKESNAVYNESVEYMTQTDVFGKVHNSENYMFSRATMGEEQIAYMEGRGENAKLEGSRSVEIKADNQIINVYFVKDSNGPDGKPDKIPDSEEYSVTYYGGRGVNAEPVSDGRIYPAGYSVKVAPNTFEHPNEGAFAYWKSDMENLEVIDSAVPEFPMPEKDVVLTAQWKVLNVFKAVDKISDSENAVKTVFDVGDRINFIITVKNTGDVDLKDVAVSDDGISVGGSAERSNVIIEADEGYTIGNNQAVIASLPVNTEVAVKAYYIVTENEISKPDVVNTATAKAGDAEATYTTPPIPMANVARQLEVRKEIVDRDITATGAFENGETGSRLYTTDDTVRFEVTVTNSGNQTMKDIRVTDDLEGAVIESGSWFSRLVNGYVVSNDGLVIKELKPGETATFKASYVIKETDLGKEFYNIVTARNDDGEWWGNSKTIPVEDRKAVVKVEKSLDKITDRDGIEVTERKPKEEDVIYYQIRVENVGNIDIDNVIVEDILSISPEDTIEDRQVSFEATEGVTINGNKVIITKLERGTSQILNCSYTVRRDDAGKTVNNTVAVTRDEKPDDPKLEIEVFKVPEGVDIQELYTLTIRYQFADGSEAFPTEATEFYAGDILSINIPGMPGYTSAFEGILVEPGERYLIGPSGNREYLVIYTAIPAVGPSPEPTDTPATPTPVPGGEEPVPEDDTPVPPVPPADDEVPVAEPAEPAAPVAGAVAPPVAAAPAFGPGLLAVADEPVPLDGVITEDDDGNIVIVPVDEVEIPLADRELDDHKCCILSFLLMLETLIIYSWFTHSMKKRQKKLAELKDQLAEETLKRQLGITDNENSAR